MLRECVWKGGNTEVRWEGWEHRSFGKGVNTLKCIGKGVNTEVCWEGWDH